MVKRFVIVEVTVPLDEGVVDQAATLTVGGLMYPGTVRNRILLSPLPTKFLVTIEVVVAAALPNVIDQPATVVVGVATLQGTVRTILTASDFLMPPPPPGPPPPPPPTPLPTALTLAASSNPAPIGSPVTFSGNLTYSGLPLSGASVLFEYSPDGVTFAPESQTAGQFPPTDSTGRFAATITIGGTTPHSEYFRARFVGNASFGPSTSPVVVLSVVTGGPPVPPPPPPPPGPPVGTTLTLTMPATAIAGVPVTATGRLTRNDNLAGVATQPIVFEASLDNVLFVSIGTGTTDATGNYAVPITFVSAGSYFVRARYAGGTVP